jgi:hypothetical protein
VVIFGFGQGQAQDLGEVAPVVCPNCHNQVFLHHVRSKKSFSLYFVPVAHYGTDEYLVCPICSRGLQLSRPQVTHARTMAGTTASFRRGQLTQPQYAARVEVFWRQLGMNPVAMQPSAPAGTAAPARPAGPPQPTPARPAPAPAPGPAAAASDDETSWIAHLQKLAQLHDQGVISDADYEAAKRRVLEQK